MSRLWLVRLKYKIYIRILQNFGKYQYIKKIDLLYNKFFGDDNSFHMFKLDTLTHDLILSHMLNNKELLNVFMAWRFMYNFSNSINISTYLIRYKLLSLIDSTSIDKIILRNSILQRYFNRSFVVDYLIIRQLLDDIFDYGEDKKYGKNTFVTYYGIKMAKKYIKKARSNIISNSDVPEFLKYLVQYFY